MVSLYRTFRFMMDGTTINYGMFVRPMNLNKTNSEFVKHFNVKILYLE